MLLIVQPLRKNDIFNNLIKLMSNLTCIKTFETLIFVNTIIGCISSIIEM